MNNIVKNDFNGQVSNYNILIKNLFLTCILLVIFAFFRGGLGTVMALGLCLHLYVNTDFFNESATSKLASSMTLEKVIPLVMGAVILSVINVALVIPAIAEDKTFGSEDLKQVCPFSPDSERFIEYQVQTSEDSKPIKLRVPEAYFPLAMVRPKQGETRSATLMDMWATDFSALPKKKPSQADMKPILSMLVSRFVIDMEMVKRYQVDLYKKARLDNLSRDNRFYPEKDGPFGLIEMDYEPSKREFGHATRVFLKPREDGLLTEVITCASKTAINAPRCEQIMLLPHQILNSTEVSVQLSYPSKLLSEWRLLSDRTRIFLKCITR